VRLPLYGRNHVGMKKPKRIELTTSSAFCQQFESHAWGALLVTAHPLSSAAYL
jgi:hypothetical protein